MKELAGYAQRLVEKAARLNGHLENDWAILASVRTVTQPWAPSIGHLFGESIYGSPEHSVGMEKYSREDREQAVSIWFERIASGFPGANFWAETALIGFYHAAAGVTNDSVLAFMSRLDSLLLLNCARALPPPKAIEVGCAFKRVFGVAQALMIESYEHAIITGVTQLGFNPRLMARMRSVAVRKMVDEGRNSMALMTWDDSLSVGVAEIDAQHHRLVELLNQVHHSSSTGKGDDTVRTVLEGLAKYTVEHFAYEESLFTKHNFPDFRAHKDAHEKLVGRVLSFMEEWKAGRAAVGMDLFMFLRSWLNGHIRGSDRAAGRFLRSQGVQ